MPDEPKKNLQLPGNPRYQPKRLIPHFGYDNLYCGVAEIELAVLDVMAEIGVIPPDDSALLTEDVRTQVFAITTTEVDRVEREITRHDIRAWVRLAQERMPPALRRWVHVPLTSYDVLDSGRILTYDRAYWQAVRPAIAEVMGSWADVVEEHASTLQIGRHGQHALPITVGFWLGTILGRAAYCLTEMDRSVQQLRGKISGAVGAYNAQVGLGIAQRCGAISFEERVLERVGLRPAQVSTQIVQPEPLAQFLFAAVLMSQVLGQLGRDCRHLMRTEIAEVTDPFEPGQVGSSTMAHKRNPINFENSDGTAIQKQIPEFMKVLLGLISEHQRDLTGSPAARDFPAILVNLVSQLETLLRPGKADPRPFIRRIGINREALDRNFGQSAHLVLAEPLYIALQMAGYEGDAHEVVNKRAMPLAQQRQCSLVMAVSELAESDEALARAIGAIPVEVRTMLCDARRYTGSAADEALRFATAARIAIDGT